ncbi:LacI family DNA-binding transcriptional regulator [Paraburkholderia sp. RL17-373-BIF-A]|uniref:LacI family DNA-binding transcriptional regulator n=1 Tax=Paraburkholderia sp. RL17-373-BIF-A TaxID=3031629 RepID=UPI0038BD579F
MGKTRPGGHAVRMIDVARAANVSLMTVSRALKEPALLSEETRKLVLDTVRRVGYVPNHIASNLASARSNVVGQIVPSIQNSLYSHSIKGCADVLRTAGVQLLLADSGYSLEDEEALIDAFLAQRVCGLVLHNTVHTPRATQMIRAAGIPIVETGDLARTPIDMAVSYSNFNAAKEMTLYLAGRGYKSIGFVCLTTKNNMRARERLKGYHAALTALGRERNPGLVREVEGGLTSGAHAMVDMMQRAPEVDAIFFAGDVLAVGALFEAQRRNWKVPERIAIAGFDDLDILRHTVPRLTCLNLPRLEIGRRSAEALLQRMRSNEPAVPTKLDLGFEIIQREST